MKELIIPRLELLSAKILAVLVDTVCNAWSFQIKIDCVRYWLDSKTAIYWVYNNGEWKQWVHFRVNEILRRLSKKEDWEHVGGKENPADLGSRGVTASQLNGSDLCRRGPKWLGKGKNCWPKGWIAEDSEEVEDERQRLTSTITVHLENLSELQPW